MGFVTCSSGGWELGLRDPEIQRDVPELDLDDLHVPRAHAKQLFLRGRQRLEALVRQRIGNRLLLQRDVRVDDRCRQQVRDRALEHAVDLVLRDALLGVRLHDPWTKRPIQARRAARVELADRVGIGVVALIVLRIEIRPCARRPRAKLRRRRLRFQMARRRLPLCDVERDDGEVADQVVGREPGGDAWMRRELADQLADDRIGDESKSDCTVCSR